MDCVDADVCLALTIDQKLILEKRRLTKRVLDIEGRCKVYDQCFVSESGRASRCENSQNIVGMENEHVRLFAVQGEGEGCSVGALLIDAASVRNGGATSGGS